MQTHTTTAIRCSECPRVFLSRCNPWDHEAFERAATRHGKEHDHRGASYDSLDPPYWRKTMTEQIIVHLAQAGSDAYWWILAGPKKEGALQDIVGRIVWSPRKEMWGAAPSSTWRSTQTTSQWAETRDEAFRLLAQALGWEVAP